MSTAAADRDRDPHPSAMSGPLLAGLVATAALGLLIYLTPPHLGALGPEEMRFWVVTRIVWVAVACSAVTYTAIRLLRRR